MRSPDPDLTQALPAVFTETESLVCVLDGAGRILLFNEGCEHATGFTREEVLGAGARDFVIPPEEADSFGEVLAHIWRTGFSSPQVGHWVTKDGGRRLIAWSNKPELAEVSRLAQEQRALRRVATLVASEAPPERVFTAVSDECARVLEVNGSAVFRFEGDDTATVVGRHDRDDVGAFAVGDRIIAD